MARQEYVQRNRQWLQDKASESGVMPIDKVYTIGWLKVVEYLPFPLRGRV